MNKPHAKTHWRTKALSLSLMAAIAWPARAQEAQTTELSEPSSAVSDATPTAPIPALLGDPALAPPAETLASTAPQLPAAPVFSVLASTSNTTESGPPQQETAQAQEPAPSSEQTRLEQKSPEQPLLEQTQPAQAQEPQANVVTPPSPPSPAASASHNTEVSISPSNTVLSQANSQANSISTTSTATVTTSSPDNSATPVTKPAPTTEPTTPQPTQTQPAQTQPVPSPTPEPTTKPEATASPPTPQPSPQTPAQDNKANNSATPSTPNTTTSTSTNTPESSTPTGSTRIIRIVTADSLELRQIDGQEFVIIAGQRVELRVGDDVVTAQRVEYNRVKRTLTLLGEASYLTAKTNQTLSGDNLSVDLAKQSVSGQDVLISDNILEIRGMEVERIPGQLRTTRSTFTPCARCGRTPNDYSVRAEEMILYPGDRLIARRAQVMLGDIPVLYLPILAVPLNEPARQPRLSIANSVPDGLAVEADLPFAISDNTLGVSKFRYYEKRSPSVGGGVDLSIYGPNDYVDRLDLSGMALPKPVSSNTDTSEGGYQTDFSLSARGRIPLEYATSPLSYSLNAKKTEIGRSESATDYGVTFVDFGAKVSYPRFDLQFDYVDRLGKPLDDNTIVGSSVPKKTELILDPKPISTSIGNGEASADFRLTAGQYTAPSNPESRLASLQGKYITANRFRVEHTLGYTLQPWQNAEFAIRNTFLGNYYSTGARTVDLSIDAGLTQRFGPERRNSFGVSQGYVRREGTSPFSFDRLSVNRLVELAPLKAELRTVPTKDAFFNVSYNYDFIRPKGQSEAKNPANLVFSVGAKRAPVDTTWSLRLDLAEKRLDDFSYSVTLADPNSGKTTLVPASPAVPATPTSPAIAARPAYLRRSSAWPVPSLSLSASGGYAYSTGLKPVNLVATISPPDFRTNTFSVKTTLDLRPDKELISSLGIDFSLTSPYDVVLNPVSISGSEVITFDKTNPSIKGNFALNWRDLTLSTDHSFNFGTTTAKHNGTVNFALGNTSGSAQSWRVAYGGPFDTRRGGFTAPLLSGSLSSTEPGKVFRATASVSMKGLDQERTELADASVEANWQENMLAIGGRATYRRSRSGNAPNDLYTDTLIFDPLRIGIGIGNGPRPGAYVTAALRQTFTFKENDPNPYNAPLAPVIGLTIDRCCWALQGEIDPINRRFKIALGLPGQYTSLFDFGPEGVKSPLWPFGP